MPQHVTVNEEGEARGLIGLRGSGRTRSCMPRDHELAGSQAVAVGDQDGGGIPMAPAVFAGSLNELLDFPLGKVVPIVNPDPVGNRLRIGRSCVGCAISAGWSPVWSLTCFGHEQRWKPKS
jgi:hypothetical protein